MQEDNRRTTLEEQKVVERRSIDEVQQLMRQISVACEKNRGFYKKILKTNSTFRSQLYNPPIHLNTKKDKIELTKQILVKQMARLLDQQNKLKKQLGKIEFKQLEQDFEKQNQRNKQANHYLFLRTVWKRPIEPIDSQDKIEKLNKSVALIKAHILSQTKLQTDYIHKNILIDSFKYDQLKQDYEKLLMEREDRFQQQRTIKVSTDQHNRIKHLENENYILRNQIKEYKQKLICSQKENLKYLKKISELETALIAKPKQISKRSSTNITKFTNTEYQIEIKSDLLVQSEQMPLQLPLDEILKFLESSKNVDSKEKSIQIVQNKAERFLDRTELKKRNSKQQIPGRSRRLKSIGEKGTIQEDLKKARFIRTKKVEDEKSILDEYMAGIKFPERPKFINFA